MRTRHPSSHRRRGGRVDALVNDGTLTDRLARQVIEGVIAGEGTPAEVVEKRNLKVVSDDGALIAAIDAALAQQPDVLEKIRDGKVQAAGAVIGAVMKAMGGAADAGRVRELVLERATAKAQGCSRVRRDALERANIDDRRGTWMPMAASRRRLLFERAAFWHSGRAPASARLASYTWCAALCRFLHPARPDPHLALHPRLVTRPAFDRLGLARFGRSVRHQLVEHPPGRVRDLLDRLLECRSIGARRMRRPAHFADELQRGLPHLVIRGRGLEIVKAADVAAHAAENTSRRPRTRMGWCSPPRLIYLQCATVAQPAG